MFRLHDLSKTSDNLYQLVRKDGSHLEGRVSIKSRSITGSDFGATPVSKHIVVWVDVKISYIPGDSF